MTVKLEAIVFDLDGTLIDSAPELALALNSGLSEAGRRRLDVEEVKMLVGDGIDKLVERGLEATGGRLGAERFREVADRVREFYWNVEISPPYPGVPEMLAKLHGDGLKLAICTNKPLEPTLKILKGVGIAGRFAAVAGGDGPAGRKPDAGPLRAVLAEIGAARGGRDGRRQPQRRRHGAGRRHPDHRRRLRLSGGAGGRVGRRYPDRELRFAARGHRRTRLRLNLLRA